MKQISLVLAIVTVSLLTACKKDAINNTEDRVGGSRVTRFAVVTLNGESVITVPAGTTYVDPGASAKEGGAETPVTSSNPVDANVPGVYTVTYTAVNKDGFPASASRTVVVYNTDASAAAQDLSGNYARTSNGSVATWTKIAPGVYTVFNPGGAPGTNLSVYVFNPTGSTIKIPSQRTSDGNITTSSNESFDATSVPNQYSWVIINPGYGTALRTFVKQ